MEREPVTPAERVEAELRALLGTMRTGQALPSVRELADRYGVSSATVQKAMRRLKAEGLVTSRQGWATFKA